jgi:hypothetical protein
LDELERAPITLFWRTRERARKRLGYVTLGDTDANDEAVEAELRRRASALDYELFIERRETDATRTAGSSSRPVV